MNKQVESKGPRGNKLVSSEKKYVKQEMFGMLMIWYWCKASEKKIILILSKENVMYKLM